MNRDAFLIRWIFSGVHVKAIGSDNEKFQSGETDLRGIWIAQNLRGTATVIARDEKGNFAFYRGQDGQGLVRRERVQPAQNANDLNYNGSNYLRQDSLWKANKDEFEKQRRSKDNGVKVNKAIKK